MSEACERWASIADRNLVGDPVSEEDARFFETHAAECELCGAEARAYAELAASRDQVEPLASSHARELVNGALGKLSQPSPKPAVPLEVERERRQIRLGAGVAVVLAAAAALIFWLRPATTPGDAVTATLASVRGDVLIDGRPAKDGAIAPRGARLSTKGGRACVTWPGNVRACLERQTDVVLAEVAPRARRLELERGLVVAALDPLPSGHVFVVTSSETRTEVKGTVFSVTRSPSGPAVVVRVHEGVVTARTGDSPARDVGPNEQLALATGSVTPIPAEVRRRDLEIAAVSLPEPPKPPPALPAPAPDAESSAESTDAATTGADARVAAPPPDAGKSAAELLKEAQTLRASGNSAAAAAAYRRLQALHPKSAEAQASRVSLAELLLASDPAGALAAYDAYLRGGGGLRQEAEYGRIVALGRLGRATEERAAIEAFVKKYPNSVQARTLSQRLGDAAR